MTIQEALAQQDMTMLCRIHRAIAETEKEAELLLLFDARLSGILPVQEE